MSIIAEDSGIKKELVPAGNHVARCYSMIQIGTVETEYLGQKRKAHKVRITWELPNEMRVFDESKGEQPMVISKKYTLSMHEKSNLRRDLESWRGKAYTEDQAKRFDITKLLGVPCMLNIIQSEFNGNEFSKISGITPIPKGLDCPEQINPTFELSFSNWSDEKFNELPDFIKNEIMSSEEYKRRTNPVDESDEPTHDDEFSDLPF